MLRSLMGKALFSFKAWQEGNHYPLIGLDINAGFIKFLQINTSEKPFKIENLAIKPLPSGYIIKDEIKHSEEIAAMLRDILREINTDARHVAIAIPRALAITKSILIDNRLTDSEIESRAWIEASRHFPDLVGDIYLDFIVTGPAPQDPSQLELILVACRKDHIKPYLEILHLAGLEAQIVDLNSYALERALLQMESEKKLETVALLNLNIDITTLIVMEQKKLIHAHDQVYEGEHFAQQVKNYLKEKQLESIANEADLLADAEYLNLLKVNLTSHLRHIMHFFSSSRPNVSIQQIILSGDCATIPKLSSFIQQETGIPTQIANPFINMVVEERINQSLIKEYAPAFAQSCGLALSTSKVMS